MDFTSFVTRSRKSVVFSAKGMVASSQNLASEVGLSILRSGGNAADAAIATAAALNVVEPVNCGIGGDVFAIGYEAKTGKVCGLNGSGRSPAALTLKKAREMGINTYGIPGSNINSVTVPGSAAAWVDIHREWGSGRKTLLECLQPAIDLAEQGFPVSTMSANEWKDSVELLATRSKAGKEFLLDGKAPTAGQIFNNPNLAKTFKTLAEKGKDGFYRGRIAQAIVDVIQEQGGLMTLEDLSSHNSEFIDTISYTYGSEGLTVHQMPPNGQGLATLIALGIIDALRETGVVDIEKLQQGTVEWYHLLIEAIRLALSDVVAYVADPQKQKVPVDELLSKDYLRKRAKLFDPKKAKAQLEPGNPYDMNSSDTVYFCCTDAEGNGVSFIMSNFAGFGNGSVPEGCGFTLQNRGSGFALDENSPNCLEGGKRPRHTIIPAMITKKGDLYATFGVMGGNAQAQSQLQVFLNHVHHGHHPQSALDAPRFLVGGNASYKVPSKTPFYNQAVAIEEGIPEDIIKQLNELGHETEVLTGIERLAFGKGQMILKTTDARTGRLVWAAGSDPRSDGVALPQI